MDKKSVGESISKTEGFQDMMASPVLSRLLKNNSAKQKSTSNNTTTKPEEKKESVNKKDPNFSTISAGTFRPLKMGDSEADILAKMYNFMVQDYEVNKKQDALDEKYRKQLTEQKDKFTNELIVSLTGKKPAAAKKSSKSTNFSKLAKIGIMGAGALGTFFLAEKALANVDWKSLLPDFTKGGDSGTAGSLDETKAKDIYDYLTKEKGLTHEQAVGMVTNIQAESSFKPGAIGDNGTSGGLFQHHAERFESMKKEVGSDWQKDWKGQIDFALKEKEGKEYTSKQYKSTEESTRAFTKGFEKPKDAEAQAQKRVQNIPNIERVISGQPIIKQSKIFGKFGEHRGDHMHGGVDIKGRTGDAVVSTEQGVVTNVGNEPSGYGTYIEIDHGNNIRTRYAHLSKTDIKAGDTVTKGQKIGEVGSTGHSTGPHLHYEVLQNNVKVDPNSFMKISPVTTASLQAPESSIAAIDEKFKETKQIKKTMTSGQVSPTTILSQTNNNFSGDTNMLVSTDKDNTWPSLISKQYPIYRA
jgi:murein DD-endopeptidase MepM/ murein hydrolase activator NlpD